MKDEISSAVATVKQNALSFCKFISANDAGATGGHQAGIYIPKGSWQLIFDSPGIKGANKERFATITWFDGSSNMCCFKYYGSGTRNEYRITRLGRPVNIGQLFVIVKKDENEYLGYFLDEFSSDLFLKELELSEEDTNSLIYRNAGNIDHTGSNQVTQPELTEIREEPEASDSLLQSVPTFDDLMEPTFRAMKILPSPIHVDHIEAEVSNLLQLSEEDQLEIHRGTTTKLSYRLAWARNYLKRFGLIENVSKGIWALTPKGENTSAVDKNEIKQAVRKVYNDSEEFEDDIIELDIAENETAGEPDDVESPFDPKDIKIVVEPKTIDHLVTRLRYSEIDMNTEFQRKGNLWKPEVQSRLIESILLRLPLPPFYFDAADENNWLVVDGLQRLWTLKNFIVNSEPNALSQGKTPLQLTGLEILTDYNDKNISYDRLSRTMQRRILETSITAYLIQPGTPKSVKYNVFRRINTGGLSLNSMEIRNALNQGNASNFLRDLSEDQDLRTILKLQDRRMEDRELLLRACAFINSPYTNYTKPLATFLDKAMESLANKTEEELDTLYNGVIDAVFFQFELFGKHFFSRSISEQTSRPKLNSALFEVWVSETYKLSHSARETLLRNRLNLISEYRLLLRNEDFYRSIATSTSGKAAVRTRFEGIQSLIQRFSQ